MTTEATPPPPSAGPVPEPHPRAPAFPPPVPPTAPLKDTSGLAIATVVLSGLLALCFLASSGSAVWLASAVPAGGTVDDVAWVPLAVYGLASLLVVPVGLAAWLVTGFWCMNVRSNAEILVPTTRHTRSRAWGLWGWVVPIVSLWFPYQYVRDVHGATDDRAKDSRIGWWWAAWLVVVIGARVESRATDSLLEGGGSAGTVTFVAAVGMAAVVASLVMWAGIVRAVERGLAARAVEPLR